MKIPFSLIVALTLLAFSLSARAKVIHVNETAALGGDGTTWATACRYLQDALDLTVAGDEVWVAAGTYFPDDGATFTTGDRTASFTLKQNVKLYGGFVGQETTLGQQNSETNVTLLSGEIWAEKLYWSLHVVTLAGSATLDGVTVADGNANGEAAPFNQGGAVFVSESFSLISNQCIFTSNSASSEGGAIYSSSAVTATNCTFSGNTVSSHDGKGGAISSSTVTVTNCTFSGNTTSSSSSQYANNNGGAIYSSAVTATNCTFSGNTASSDDGKGGAISSSTVRVTNCTFSDNTASYIGGAIFSPTVMATNCTFSGNTASSHGGAISSSTVTATNCTFSGNTSSYGGAITGTVTATNCTFSGNTASYQNGGAIASGTVTATNCIFSDNTASSHGGAISSSTITATNCTFSGNSAYSSYNYGGGAIFSSYSFSSFSSTVTATNCIFSDNTASFHGGAIDSSSTLTATNCMFSGNTASSHGGAISSISAATVTNCTLINNQVSGAGKKGGAIYASGILKLYNNLLWHTLAETQENLIYITSTGSIRNSNSQFPSPLNQAKNLIKRGITAITAETGAVVSLGDTAATLLSGDPLFLSSSNPLGSDGIWGTADDGLRLQETSPAQDLGLSMFLPADTYDLDKDGDLAELIPVDLTGYARIQRAALDLGAYEVGDSVQPIAILTQPESLPLLRDLTATFTVTATGYALQYQWYLGNSSDVSNPVTGATGNSYTTPELSATSSYWVRASNRLGFVDSQTATATVVPIVITTQPADTVTAPGGAAALSIAASGRNLEYQWYQGASGDTENPIAGAFLPAFTSSTLTETTTFWVRITNSFGSLDSAVSTVTVVVDPVMVALNTPDTTLFYTAGGSAPWFAQSSTTRDGYVAAQSGAITHSQTSTIQTSVSGAGTISFWWNVSSQSGGDYLRFYIDGVEKSGSISGTSGTWAKKTFPVTAEGLHTFKWSYMKNSSTSSGSDCGWVDEVVWTPKLITTQPTERSILSGTGAELEVVATGSGLSYQWFQGDSGETSDPVPGANSPTFTTPALTSTTKFWVRVGDGAGYETSTAATVTILPPNAALATALDSGPAISYFTWGDQPWIVQSAITHGGVSALQSGAITNSQISRTEAVVSGAGTLSFWWKASSELGFDFVKFRVDGTEQGSLSGETGWQQVNVVVVGPGTHTLSWSYEKDISKNSGSDKVWLDQVSWQAAGAGTSYASWTTLHNLTGDDALSTANPSRDGINNLMKYALGLNPKVPTLTPTDGMNPGLPRMDVSGGAMTFTFIKDTAKSDLTYTVESSTTLNNWSPVNTGIVETPLTGSLVRIVATFPVSGQQFCRLKATK